MSPWTHPGILRLSCAVLSAAVVAALLTYAWRGWYARYVADDYCTAALLRGVGFAEAMRFFRESWSGRYSFYAIKAGVESIGPVTTRYTPTVMIALLVIGMTRVMRSIAGRTLLTTTAGLVAAYAVVDSSPGLSNITGTLFWETGAITYTLPLILLAAFVALLLSQLPTVICCVAAALVMLIAGGLSETSLAAQGVIAVGAFITAIFFGTRRHQLITGSGFFATILALTIMLSAPGNAVRAQALGERLPLDAAAMRALKLSYDYIGSYVFIEGAAFGLLLILGVIVGASDTRLLRAPAAAAAAIALAAYVVSFFPTAWIVKAGPPERTLEIPNACLMASLFALALIAGNAFRVRQRHLLGLSVLLLPLTIVPLLSLVTNVRVLPDLRTNAARMDAMDRTLRRLAGQDVVIRERWPLERRILDSEPTTWTNECVSRFYGLRSLSVRHN